MLTQTDDVMERIARALYAERALRKPRLFPPTWEQALNFDRAVCRREAKRFHRALSAAGLAIYDTCTHAAVPRLGSVKEDGTCLAMLVAGKQALFSCSEDPELEDARKCFAAMLAAAESPEDKPDADAN